MEIRGLEGLSDADIDAELRRGGRFVVFEYTVSVLVMTFKRPTAIHFIRAGENAALKSLPYTLLTMLVGWWGFPWGFIYTPMALYTNLSGGRDVTQLMLSSRGA